MRQALTNANPAGPTQNPSAREVRYTTDPEPESRGTPRSRAQPLRQDTCVSSDKTPVSPLEDPEDEEVPRERITWAARHEGFCRSLLPGSVEKLARRWGCSTEAVQRLRPGFDPEKGAFIFPMENGEGGIVGLRARGPGGAKWIMAGGRPGLFVPEGVIPADAELIVEGESDTAAALSLGIPAVGQPSANAPAGNVLRFLGPNVVPCPCIVGDNDTPGRTGAEALAADLLDEGTPCRVLMPPDPHNDLRDWLGGGLTAEALRAAVNEQPVRFPEPHRRVPGYFRVPNAGPRAGLIARIGSGGFALACLLESFDRGDGSIFPEREELAKLLGVSTRTVDRYKHKLERSGVLRWKRGRRGRCNEYALDFGPCREIYGKRPRNA